VKLLWIATKAPWPPIDGGRRLLADTLRALAEVGHPTTLVAPIDPRRFDVEETARELTAICRPELVPAVPRGLSGAVLRSLAAGRPLSIERHDLPVVGRRAAELAAGESFDVVVAEQLQALSAAERAAAQADLPVVLRAQNVESDLWRTSAERAGPFGGWLLRREARRLAAWEGRAVARAAATAALTREDAERLALLAGSERSIHAVPPPFPSRLPPADLPLPGEPAVAILGSRGWRPNVEGARWFLAEVWPRVRSELPGARLHLFGLGDLAAGLEEVGVVPHPAPAESRSAFAPGSLMAVPLHVASGIRMKILEAWARGVPVVATPAAAHGLGADVGRELLVAESAEAFAAALAELHRDPARAGALAEAGRGRLGAVHAPARVAARFEEIFIEARRPSG